MTQTFFEVRKAFPLPVTLERTSGRQKAQVISDLHSEEPTSNLNQRLFLTLSFSRTPGKYLEINKSRLNLSTHDHPRMSFKAA